MRWVTASPGRRGEIVPTEIAPVKQEEEVEPPALVNLDAMTKEQLITYTHRNWGVEMDGKSKKTTPRNRCQEHNNTKRDTNMGAARTRLSTIAK